MHRGVYVLAAGRVPLLELLAHVHPCDGLRLSGPWAAAVHLGGSPPPLAHVLRKRQARDFFIPEGVLEETEHPVRVRYVRELSEMPRPQLADRSQCALDQLAHPDMGLSMSTLRQLIGDQWPAQRLPDGINDRRRLALLVLEQTGQLLDVGDWASHQTINLDVASGSVGPIISTLNVRRNA